MWKPNLGLGLLRSHPGGVVTECARGDQSNPGDDREQRRAGCRDQAGGAENEERARVTGDPLLEQHIPRNRQEGDDAN